MTSVSQQPSSAPAASQKSYASATKKAVSSPPIATGSAGQTPTVAVGNTPAVQHGGSSISSLNGKTVPPAVPAFTNPAIVNGAGAGHSRQNSVTIAASGGYMNGGAAGGQKAGIQFGSIEDSPAASHSTPQVSQPASTPIAIPSNPRVSTPARSPSPIPQPSASGGRPPSVAQGNGVTFGSLGGDGDVSSVC